MTEPGDDGRGEPARPRPMAGRSRSMQRAKTHFAIAVGGAIVVTGLLIALGVPNVYAEATGQLAETDGGLYRSFWVALFLTAGLGALTKRAHAIAYYGFKLQEYEPVTWRYHLSVGWRASLVAVAFVGLGNVVTVGELVQRPVFALAFTFAAGYFGESTFQVFEKRFRQLIGNEQSPRKSVRRPVEGIDVPTQALDEVPDEDLRAVLDLADGVGADDVVTSLQQAGFTSTGEILGASLTSGGRGDLEDALEDLLERGATVDPLVRLADLQRVGVPAPLAAGLVQEGVGRAEDLADPEVLVRAWQEEAQPDARENGGSADDAEPGEPEQVLARLVAKRAQRLAGDGYP